MDDKQTLDDSQSIAQELYSKNVDLLNANKVLELIQELYDIMISSYSIESVSQRFINMITEKMGFSDGIVVVGNKENNNLEISGITQTELNLKIMELTSVATVNYKFNVEAHENILAEVYNTGLSRSSYKIYDVWTPYLKAGDLSESENKLILAYPILYGKEVLGSFALIAGNKGELTEFEKKALERIVTVFGIAMDRVKINEELQLAHERELMKAREVIKLKDEFVFIATHDLRTPVTAIKGFSELLKPEIEKLSADAREDFDAIYQSAERLDQLVEDLLEVARSESGNIYIETKPTHVKEIIDKAVSEIEVSAQKRGITVKVELESDSQMVLADPEKLREVFENLLSNAVKYNKENGTVSLTSKTNGESVIFTISDTGIGVPQDMQPKMFEKFFRARQIGTEEIPGTGLGMFVVRMLVEKMKGQISFVSKEGEGTTFTFSLPMAME